MSEDSLFVIILAAGKGTRMKSARSKVFHPLGGRFVVESVIETARALGPREIVLVVSPDSPAPPPLIKKLPDVCLAYQEKALGTGDAVRSGLKGLSSFDGETLPGDVFVLFGDTPLIAPSTLRLMQAHKASQQDAAVIVLGMRPPDASGYGRLCAGALGDLESIVEFQEASPEIRQLGLCNSGVMLLDGKRALPLLNYLSQRNQAKEYYLTEIVSLARQKGLRCLVVEAPWEELLGINSREDLSLLEKFLQQRWRRQALNAGVTLLDPETVYFSFDTTLAQDVTVHPFVFFGPGVNVGRDVTIFPFSRLEETHIEPEATVGPFCHLRAGTRLSQGVQIGNFVETKNATFLKGAKAKHLSYVGDAHVGSRSNIGAGTITCNYDGKKKSMTWIGEDVFIGSNTALVAPLRVEDRSLVGAGSVITQDIPPESLALGRSRQRNILGKAPRIRSKNT